MQLVLPPHCTCPMMMMAGLKGKPNVLSLPILTIAITVRICIWSYPYASKGEFR